MVVTRQVACENRKYIGDVGIVGVADVQSAGMTIVQIIRHDHWQYRSLGMTTDCTNQQSCAFTVYYFSRNACQYQRNIISSYVWCCWRHVFALPSGAFIFFVCVLPSEVCSCYLFAPCRITYIYYALHVCTCPSQVSFVYCQFRWRQIL